MSDEVLSTTTEAVKKVSDGTVNIAIEKYEEMLETIAAQKGSIARINDLLTTARNQPPVINRTVVNKTAEILAQENRAWGVTLMGVGAATLAVGVYRYRASKS